MSINPIEFYDIVNTGASEATMYRNGQPVEIQTAPNAWRPATAVIRCGRLLARTPDGEVYADPHPDKIRPAR